MDKEDNANGDHEEASKYVFDLGLEDDIVEDEESEEEEERMGNQKKPMRMRMMKMIYLIPKMGLILWILWKTGTRRQEGRDSFERKLEDKKCETSWTRLGGRRTRRSSKLKKKGRRKGSKNQCSPEITRLLSKARFCYAFGHTKRPYQSETSNQASTTLPDSYQTLGDVHRSLGDKMRALNCYQVAALLAPKNPCFVDTAFTKFIEVGNISGAATSLSRAISADSEAENVCYPEVRSCFTLCSAKDYEKAAALSRALPLPDHRKVNREKKRLQEKAKLKEEKRAEAMAAGDDWQSDDYSDSDDDIDQDHYPHEIQREPPLPDLVKEKENHGLILDLCKSLTSLNRHSEALNIIKLALKSTKGMSSFRGGTSVLRDHCSF
ncbi:hypothetical protein M0R45_011173 [Rubus argutus]|uniref:Uncharacterized protein n=1 Tax=Rubus argutus TaxID=59490 RepID=A0AAW1YD85_RUBAR